jgi:hypothetical protein
LADDLEHECFAQYYEMGLGCVRIRQTCWIWCNTDCPGLISDTDIIHMSWHYSVQEFLCCNNFWEKRYFSVATYGIMLSSIFIMHEPHFTILYHNRYRRCAVVMEIISGKTWRKKHFHKTNLSLHSWIRPLFLNIF